MNVNLQAHIMIQVKLFKNTWDGVRQIEYTSIIGRFLVMPLNVLDSTLHMLWNSYASLPVDGWEALTCYWKSYEVP